MRMFLVMTLLCAAAVQSVSAQDEWRPRRRSRGDGLHLRIAKDYYLPADQVVTRRVVIVGGAATIDGTVEDDFVVIGGSVRVGPTAHIRGDLTTVGGAVIVAAGADVTGQIHDVSVVWPELRFVLRDWIRGADRGWWAVLSLLGNIFRLTLVMIAACVLAFVAPGWIGRIARRSSEVPLAAGLAGFAAQVLFVPVLAVTVAALVITLIGIPLLLLVPFVLLGLAVVWLAGFAAVAAHIGRRFRSRTGGDAIDVPVFDIACGVALLGVLSVIGSILALGPAAFGPAAAACAAAGVAIEYLAWTVGLGAALLAPFRPRWNIEPPPLPSRANASAIA
jgi:hypothetical protein